MNLSPLTGFVTLIMTQQQFKHVTVLLDEAVNGLNIKPNGIYIDGTFVVVIQG